MVIEEACAKCFDEFFNKPYKRKYTCKSRKVKEARRHVTKYHLLWGNTNQIRLIADDYIYVDKENNLLSKIMKDRNFK